MATQTVHVELPDEFLSLLGSTEAAAELMKEAAVMELLRRAEISQGKAAHLLGIRRWDLPALMGRYHVPSGPRTAEEVDAEVAVIREYLAKRATRASR